MSLIAAFHDALAHSDERKAREIGARILASDPAYPPAIRSFVDLRIEQMTHSPAEAMNSPRGVGSDLVENPDRALLHGEFALPTVPVAQIEERYYDYAEISLEPRPFRTIAFYLPQFHPFAENDRWWGRGFTEWSNVGKATPLFEGHYQPHCPIHFGYYDLRLVENMVEQAKVARNYGIDGFSYYFYWFNGQSLMELPLRNMLLERKVDIPFCLTWANENWTRRWDGQENEILIAQKHSLEDSRQLIIHLLEYFRDERYIKVNGKPVLIVYRADIIPEIRATAEMWQKLLQDKGFPGLHLVAAQTFGITDPRDLGFDAAVEFPPHAVASEDIRHTLRGLRPDFDGHIFSYKQVINGKTNLAAGEEFPQYYTAMLSWDNTARKGVRSHLFHGFTLGLYQRWLRMNICRSLNHRNDSEHGRLLFINAWNEWAEGTHLEPDRSYGFGYLQATADVVKEFAGTSDLPWHEARDPRRTHSHRNSAVFVHVHYLDVWPALLERLEQVGILEHSDLYVTTNTVQKAVAIHESCPEAVVDLCENRGRDVLPFLQCLRTVRHHPYGACLKIHTKKSAYRSDGALILRDLLDSLLPSREGVAACRKAFEADSSLGMLQPGTYRIPHGDKNLHFNHSYLQQLCQDMGLEFRRGTFPAGSMFWFRPAALTPLLAIPDCRFEAEIGLADGTAAHAVERLFSLVAEEQGFRCQAC